MNKTYGFTVIELLIVLAIVGIAGALIVGVVVENEWHKPKIEKGEVIDKHHTEAWVQTITTYQKIGEVMMPITSTVRHPEKWWIVIQDPESLVTNKVSLSRGRWELIEIGDWYERNTQ